MAKEGAGNLVIIQQVQGQLRAAVIRSALESAGIPVLLRYEALGVTMGLTVDGVGRVDILVPAEWEAEARDLLNTDNPDKAENQPMDDDQV